MSGRRVTRAHIASATIATSILAGGAYLGLAHGAPPQTRSMPRQVVEPTRPPEPPARGADRTAVAPPQATPSPTAAKATVTSSGSCGASYYDEPQGTANGETFDPEALTAAHKSLPFNTRVRVTNPGTGKSVVVRINDRGPYIDGRCLDLSRAAFREIANLGQGVLSVVNYEVLAR